MKDRMFIHTRRRGLGAFRMHLHLICCKILLSMHHPAIIRTDFASAEDIAEIYGVPISRVETIKRMLMHPPGNGSTQRQPSAAKKSRRTGGHTTSRIKGKKRSASKTR